MLQSSIIKNKTTIYTKISDRYLSASIGIILGFVLIFGAGFSNSEIIHKAAHDVRHSVTFPCH